MNQTEKVLNLLRNSPLTIEDMKHHGIGSPGSVVGKLRAAGCVIDCAHSTYTLVQDVELTKSKIQHIKDAKVSRIEPILQLIEANPGINFNDLREAFGLSPKDPARFGIQSDLEDLLADGKIRSIQAGRRNRYYLAFGCDLLCRLYSPKPKVKVTQTRHIEEKRWTPEKRDTPIAIQSPFSYVTFGM